MDFSWATTTTSAANVRECNNPTASSSSAAGTGAGTGGGGTATATDAGGLYSHQSQQQQELHHHVAPSSDTSTRSTNATGQHQPQQHQQPQLQHVQVVPVQQNSPSSMQMMMSGAVGGGIPQFQQQQQQGSAIDMSSLYHGGGASFTQQQQLLLHQQQQQYQQQYQPQYQPQSNVLQLLNDLQQQYNNTVQQQQQAHQQPQQPQHPSGTAGGWIGTGPSTGGAAGFILNPTAQQLQQHQLAASFQQQQQQLLQQHHQLSADPGAYPLQHPPRYLHPAHQQQQTHTSTPYAVFTPDNGGATLQTAVEPHRSGSGGLPGTYATTISTHGLTTQSSVESTPPSAPPSVHASVSSRPSASSAAGSGAGGAGGSGGQGKVGTEGGGAKPLKQGRRGVKKGDASLDALTSELLRTAAVAAAAAEVNSGTAAGIGKKNNNISETRTSTAASSSSSSSITTMAWPPPEIQEAGGVNSTSSPPLPPITCTADILALDLKKEVSSGRLLHRHVLQGRVGFIHFDACRSFPKTFEPPKDLPSRSEMISIFIGQLPVHVTDQQVTWMCYTFARGTKVYYLDRITKVFAKERGKVDTGCYHACVTKKQAPDLLRLFDNTILVDDCGVWVAQSASQKEALMAYARDLKSNPAMRIPVRPHGPVVVQLSNSKFNPDLQHQQPQPAKILSTTTATEAAVAATTATDSSPLKVSEPVSSSSATSSCFSPKLPKD